MYDGFTTAGPVPTIFAENPAATLEALEANPGQAHKDVMKINR
jgi:hypothetical protein